MQLNKIRMVLLRNHLENQAGSCPLERWDPASGLDCFATTTAILFSCITTRLTAADQDRGDCNTTFHFPFLPRYTGRYTASPASMESEAVSRRAETAGNRPGWECRKQDGQQSERGTHGALDEMMMRRS